MDMMSKILRHLREGFRNVLRNGWMTFASVSAVTVTLAVLGLTLILAMNAQQMSKYVTNQVQVQAYMHPNASEQAGEQLAQKLRSMPDIASVQVISKEAGMNEMKQEFGQYQDILEQYKSSPLPVQLVIKAKDPSKTLQVANEVRHMPDIDTVRDGKSYIKSLFRTVSVLRTIGIVFVIALLVTSMFLISNTIRMTIFSRRREIEIMKLVGAANWFIRWPFIVEGMLIGVFGAVVPLVILGYGYHVVYDRIHDIPLILSINLVSSGALIAKLAVVLLGIGILLGVWGGVMSVRKFLRV
ncbi:cell division protein FtsX [Alicyclobacillus acidoterrestris]|uniref:permease-like cell division protein FtsX n=1 Tax=Alicyclobacillus suci TaxID=2816080 RepID=UPI001196F523|nr:permease-like cell division protein FtsX [Alicyclobacillus suci]GEO26168.1 cell division protein FtsX [Alicyclobacillus acidoterrestris]